MTPPGPSLLRWSAAERLALAAIIIAGLWGAVLWALHASAPPSIPGETAVMGDKPL
jgi:hypothetical protein